MGFKVGDRVHYRVYPSGEPNTDAIGTVVKISLAEFPYGVQWDHVDPAVYSPSYYQELDLAKA